MDKGHPEVKIQINRCIISGIPVDGGSSVNLMTQDTTFKLRYTKFEHTPQILRMADQTRVIPKGRLSKVSTDLSRLTFLLDYIMIYLDIPSSFPVLLGRPWLYKAKVNVNWRDQKLTFGNLKVTLSWLHEQYHGKTQSDDRYTSDFSDSNLLTMCHNFENVQFLTVFKIEDDINQLTK